MRESEIFRNAMYFAIILMTIAIGLSNVNSSRFFEFFVSNSMWVLTLVGVMIPLSAFLYIETYKIINNELMQIFAYLNSKSGILNKEMSFVEKLSSVERLKNYNLIKEISRNKEIPRWVWGHINVRFKRYNEIVPKLDGMQNIIFSSLMLLIISVLLALGAIVFNSAFIASLSLGIAVGALGFVAMITYYSLDCFLKIMKLS